MEQIKGSDFAAHLLGLGVGEVVAIPGFFFAVVLVKKVNFLAGRQKHLRVLPQLAMQRRSSAFLGAEAEEVRQEGCHSAGMDNWQHFGRGSAVERLHGVKSGAHRPEAICSHVKINLCHPDPCSSSTR